jgi:hypothetical protein
VHPMNGSHRNAIATKVFTTHARSLSTGVCPSLILQLFQQQRAKGGFATVLNVQETIFVLLFLVDRGHERCIGRNVIVAKQKQSLFGGQLDSLTDHVVELTDRQVGRYQILLLIDIGNVGPVGFFTNHGDAVGVLGTNALGL